MLAKISPLEESPFTDCIVFDFTAFARKIPVKKINENGGSLHSFCDMFSHLLQTFQSFSEKSDAIHIVFDLYKDLSVKDSTRKKRSSEGFVKTAISSFDQKLPVGWKKYWNLNYNKILFQQSFIQWTMEYYKGIKQIILGGGSKHSDSQCLSMKIKS